MYRINVSIKFISERYIYMKYIIHCTAGMKSNETVLSRSDERKFLLRREA